MANESNTLLHTIKGAIPVNVVVEGITGQTNTTIEAGTLMGCITDNNTYNVYDDTLGTGDPPSQDDGRSTAVGILLKDITGLSVGNKVDAIILVKGVFIKELLTGCDADGHYKTDLKAREVVLDANKTLLII